MEPSPNPDGDSGATCDQHRADARDAEVCPYCIISRLQEDRDGKQAEIHSAHESLGELRVKADDLQHQLQQAQLELDEARATLRGRPGVPDPARLLDNYRGMVEQKLAAEAERNQVRIELDEVRAELASMHGAQDALDQLQAEAAQALAGLAAAQRWRPRRGGSDPQ